MTEKEAAAGGKTVAGKDIVTGVRALTAGEAKRFIPEGNIAEAGTFWLQDGGYRFGGESHGGVVISEGAGMEVGSTDAEASRVGVRPAITLATGDATQHIRPGDRLVFTSPDGKAQESFTYLGISGDNKFIAICDRSPVQAALGSVGDIMGDIAKNIRTWECAVVRQKELDGPARYRDEAKVAEAIKRAIGAEPPSFEDHRVSIPRTVCDAVYRLEPEVPAGISSAPGFLQADCIPHGGKELEGVVQEYAFENGDTSRQTYALSEDTLLDIDSYAREYVAENYIDLCRMDPAIVEKADAYIENPAAADGKLRGEGLGGLADTLKEAYGEAYGGNRDFRSVRDEYVAVLRAVYPVYAGFEHNAVGEDAGQAIEQSNEDIEV